MDFGGGLRALKSAASFTSPFHFNRNAGHSLSLLSNPGNNKGYCLLLPNLYITKTVTSRSSSLASRRFCAIGSGGGGSVEDNINDGGVTENGKIFNVVLVCPQIAGNTGCIARTCAATGVKLHLVEPLGYKIDDKKLKRAGLDYWPYVVVKIHSSWSEFRQYFCRQEGQKRLLAFTKHGTTTHSELPYNHGDWLVFGSETSGLPPEALLDCNSPTLGGGTLRIPMVETYVRCLNLSVSVGVALYEASRQLNYRQIDNPSGIEDADDEKIFTAQDIFA